MNTKQVTELHTSAEKALTRPLYEQVFEDPKPFVDYYYAEKCRDNRMFAILEGEKPLSMVHLNPFRLGVCGQECPGYFLVAVATDENYRHQGLMTAVLEEAYRAMEAEEIPFCWLIPVDPVIYAGMGFEVVADFQKEKLPYDRVQREFDVYCLQDETYRLRAAQEAELDQAGDSEVLPDHPVIMAKVINRKAFDTAAGKVFSEDAERLQWLKDRKLYFCEEV